MENKISLREAVTFYLLMSISPTIVTVTGFAVRQAERAAWVTPLVAVLPGIFMVWVMHRLFQYYPTSSFDEMLCDSVGVGVGKGVLVLYGIWFFVLLAVYLRFYAERMQTALLPKTGMDFLLIVMLMLLWFALHKGMKAVGNFAAVTFPMIAFLLLFLTVFALPQIKIKYLYPITYLDVVPVIKGGRAPISVMGYLVGLLFLGNGIREKTQMKKQGVRGVLLLVAVSMLMIGVSVGTCGVSVAERSPIPFFLAVKQIQIFGILERFEPLLIGVWMISDFLILYFFVYCFLQTIKSVFCMQNERCLRVPVLVLAFAMAKIVASSRFELEQFTQYVLEPIGLVFQYIIPTWVLVTVGLRKQRRQTGEEGKSNKRNQRVRNKKYNLKK